MVALALLAAGLGFYVWLHPSPPPYNGRLAWVVEAAHWLLGPVGPAVLWLTLAVSLLLLARFVWRHTSRLPSDRWL